MKIINGDDDDSDDDGWTLKKRKKTLPIAILISVRNKMVL